MNPKSLFRSLAQIFRLRGIGSPGQMAGGFCLGILIGILPKDSLVPWLLALAGLLSTANITMGLIGCGVGMLSIPFADQISDRVGLFCLQWQPIQPLIAQITELPGFELIRLENSVVTGTLVIGMVAAVPVYWIFRRLFGRLRPFIVKYCNRHEATRWLVTE